MHNEAKVKNAAWELLEAQSWGNVVEGNTQTNTCHNSANVTLVNAVMANFTTIMGQWNEMSSER